MSHSKVGSLIRKYRLRCGWTRARLARESGYESPEFILLIEQHRLRPPTHVLARLIGLLQIPHEQVVEVLLSHEEKTLLADLETTPQARHTGLANRASGTPSALASLDREEPDLKNLLTDPSTSHLLQALEDFTHLLKLYDLHVRPYTRSSILKLADISEEAKEQIAASYRQWAEWIKPPPDATLPIRIDSQKERELVQKVLAHHDLTVHEDFWKTVTDDLLIEIYGDDMVQIYRNLNFFKLCGYSLLEISICEWYTLWERPSAIFKEMMAVAQKVLSSKIDLMEYKVPRHVLRELGEANSTDGYIARACLVEFKYAASLTRGLNPKPAGAICSSRGELIAAGNNAMSIQFI